MEKSMQELIKTIQQVNAFSWQDAISLLALLASWITIYFLLRDKMEEKRPYMQISFELVRSSLACVVIRNTGNVPINIRELKFDEEFIKQLPREDFQRLANNEISNMVIFPGKQWVICLGVIVPEIISYPNTILKVNYSYSRLEHTKIYLEYVEIDFNQYAKCMVYISEIDELREVDKKMADDIKELTKEVKSIKTILVQYSNMEDTMARNLIERFEIKNN